MIIIYMVCENMASLQFFESTQMWTPFVSGSGLKSWLRSQNQSYWALGSMISPQRGHPFPQCAGPGRLTLCMVGDLHLMFHKVKILPDTYFISLVILHTFLGFFSLALWIRSCVSRPSLGLFSHMSLRAPGMPNLLRMGSAFTAVLGRMQPVGRP